MIPQKRPGGRILADALVAQGVDTVFAVPGESYLDVLDGLVVLLGGQRVHRSQLLAPPRQPLDPALQVHALLRLERRRGRRGLQSQSPGHLGKCVFGVGGAVA